MSPLVTVARGPSTFRRPQGWDRLGAIVGRMGATSGVGWTGDAGTVRGGRRDCAFINRRVDFHPPDGPCPAYPRQARTCLAMPCQDMPCPAQIPAIPFRMRRVPLPRIASPSQARHSRARIPAESFPKRLVPLPCPASHCLAAPSIALPCLALPSKAGPGLAAPSLNPITSPRPTSSRGTSRTVRPSRVGSRRYPRSPRLR